MEPALWVLLGVYLGGFTYQLSMEWMAGTWVGFRSLLMLLVWPAVLIDMLASPDE